jgi:aspartate-semialdehyde dehydrogenase
MKDRRLLRELAYIDSNWSAGPTGRVIEVRDPSTLQVIAWVASIGERQTEAAIDAASRAFAT